MRPSNIIVPSDPARRGVPVVFVDFGHALTGDTSDLDQVRTKAWRSSHNDYSRVASLLTKHFEVADGEWKEWLRSIDPKTPVVRRTMLSWHILDTEEEQVEDYRQRLRQVGVSEPDIEASVVLRFPVRPSS